MTATPVTADWAWISKDPQAGIGYGVLATSRRDADFGPFIGRYVPGAPSSTTPPEAPDAPPWITFGPVVTRTDETLMTVSVREPWRERDHAGRPVWPQKLLVMRFSELAEANASYQTISAAALRAEIPAGDPAGISAALPLEIGEQPLGELVEVVEAYGFEQLAALAAALLEGPVVVAGAGHLDRGQRLAVLDAVAALLPYGFRADLSVSSVVDNTSKHGIRLAFADFVNDGQQLVTLQDPAEPLAEPGRRYLELLRKKERMPGLATLIKHMWDAKGTYSFEAPGMALAILLDLDFYQAIRQEAAQGPVPLTLLLKFLANQGAAERCWAALDARTRDNLLASYLPGHDAKAAEAVVSCWRLLGNDVIRAINTELDHGNLEAALWCLRTAGPVEDRLLADLLVPGQEVRQQRAAMLVELLVRRDAPPPDQFPYTCDQLRFDDATGWQACLIRDLLVRDLATERPADRGKAWAWARWLCDSAFTATKWERPGWVAALDLVVFETPPPEAVPSVQSLVLSDVRWAIVLIRLASQSRCLRVLIDAAHWQFLQLTGRMPRPPRPKSVGAALGAELARDLWPLMVKPAAVASIDVARILLGGEPGDFPGDLPRESLGGYFDGLGSALELDLLEPRLAEVEEGFLRRAVPGTPADDLSPGGAWLLNAWIRDPRLAAPLVAYIASLEPAAYPYHPGLTREFWETLGRDPALKRYAAGNQLFTVVAEARRDPGAALRRSLTEDAVTSSPLARACLDACRAGLAAADMIGVLGRARAGELGAGALYEVLSEFQTLLRLDGQARRVPGQDRPDAGADLLECCRLIAHGALGEQFAEEFRRQLADRLQGEIRARQLMLQETGPAPSASRPGKLSRLSRRGR
ncbi:MAG: hypothetical protein ABSB59_12870 [Streptosporangiaceae bacterium]|jgi:hypothetical protein